MNVAVNKEGAHYSLPLLRRDGEAGSELVV